MEWQQAMKLIECLKIDNPKYAMLVAIGVYTGLRISDILNLTYVDILGEDHIQIYEHKTGKYRKIRVAENLSNTILECKPRYKGPDDKIFNMKIVAVNRALKRFVGKYRIVVKGGVSSHMLRKTFGRRIWENNNESEKSLILLSQILNHSTPEITRRYLAIQQEEIDTVIELL